MPGAVACRAARSQHPQACLLETFSRIELRAHRIAGGRPWMLGPRKLRVAGGEARNSWALRLPQQRRERAPFCAELHQSGVRHLAGAGRDGEPRFFQHCGHNVDALDKGWRAPDALASRAANHQRNLGAVLEVRPYTQQHISEKGCAQRDRRAHIFAQMSCQSTFTTQQEMWWWGCSMSSHFVLTLSPRCQPWSPHTTKT